MTINKGSNMLEQLIEKLLNDEDGISSDAYTKLIEYLTEIDRVDLVRQVSKKANSANGRFYYPES